MLKAKLFFVVFCAVLVATLSSCNWIDLTQPKEVKHQAVETPLVTIDDVNRMVTVTDPSQPERPLIIRVDTSTRTVQMTCGDFTYVNAPNYVETYTPNEVYAFSSEVQVEGRHIEHYYHNGQTLDLDIDELTGPTPEQIAAYQAFYPGGETHPDAMLMAEILTKAEPQFAQVIQERAPQHLGSAKDDGLPEMQLRPRWADISCGLAQACMALACRITPQPHACVVCAAGVFVCAIMDIFGLW